MADYIPGHNFAGGWRDYDIWRVFPALEPFYLEYEKDFNMDKGMAQLRKVSPTYPVTVCIIYLIGVYLGRRAMRNRKAFDLRGPLVVWNLALAVFSLWGALRTVPHVFYVLYKEGYTYTIIADGRDWCGGGAVGVWALWFVYSKTPELGDTVFIILRKKPLIFLHWYHHVTVLLYCWHSYYYQEAYGLYFAAMNYSVHAVMYLYYALAAVKIRLCKPYYITAMQVIPKSQQQHFPVALRSKFRRCLWASLCVGLPGTTTRSRATTSTCTRGICGRERSCIQATQPCFCSTSWAGLSGNCSSRTRAKGSLPLKPTAKETRWQPAQRGLVSQQTAIMRMTCMPMAMACRPMARMPMAMAHTPMLMAHHMPTATATACTPTVLPKASRASDPSFVLGRPFCARCASGCIDCALMLPLSPSLLSPLSVSLYRWYLRPAHIDTYVARASRRHKPARFVASGSPCNGPPCTVCPQATCVLCQYHLRSGDCDRQRCATLMCCCHGACMSRCLA